MKHSSNAKRRRAHWINFALAVPVIALVAFLVNFEECDAACADWDYVSDLLLDDGQVTRWEHGPTVATINGNPEEVNMLAGAVQELNHLLLNTGIELRFIEEGPSDIRVIFGSLEELNELNPDYQFESNVQGLAAWDQRQDALSRANIFVVRNLRQGDKWGTLLHELGHSVGIVGHTDRYISSLFHSERGYGSWSDGYSSDDRKLVGFLYLHLKSGANEAEVRTAFDTHWILRAN